MERVRDGVGSTIPQAPASTLTPFTNGDIINLIYIGGPAQPYQIIFQTDTGQEYTFEQLAGTIIDNGTSQQGIYNYAKYGNLTLVSWRYITTRVS